MRVSKYSASGNDFVIFHSFVKKNRQNLAKILCHRQNGVGADGLIVLLPHKNLDFEWEFYNCDGSIAFMCGNGTRAAAHYAFSNNLAPKDMKFLTNAGEISSSVSENIVESELTSPILLKDEFKEQGRTWFLYNTGVEHLVTFVKNTDEFDLKLAIKMRQDYNANVNFAKIGNDLFVRTYERGVEDETLACGTGMAACFYAALQKKLIPSQINVYPKSNERLSLREDGGKIFLKGEVKFVFDAILKEINDI